MPHLTHKADLGQIDQAIWNTAHGRFVQEMADEQVSTRLTDHVEPIFAPLSLIFWVWDDVRALLMAQALALALGAIPFFCWPGAVCMAWATTVRPIGEAWSSPQPIYWPRLCKQPQSVSFMRWPWHHR